MKARLQAALGSSPPAFLSQLWIEDRRCLAQSAAALKPDATIVELGTAQGGSAYIFCHAAPGRAAVYSYDITASAEASRVLRGLNVRRFIKPSAQGAADWKKDAGRPVDMIFIDASHTFENVHRDFSGWLPHLRPGARVLFHDFDPVERGGASHLGVRVFLDGLLACGLLENPNHQGRVLSATIPAPRRGMPTLDVFASAYRQIAVKVSRLRRANFSNWAVLGGKSAIPGIKKLLPALVGSRPRLWMDALPPKVPPRVLIVERPLSAAGLALSRQAAARTELLDDLSLGYLLQYCLRSRRDALLALCRDRRAFFKWEEYLEMLEHSAGPDSELAAVLMRDLAAKSVSDLSRACAREMLRNAILAKIQDSLSGD